MAKRWWDNLTVAVIKSRKCYAKFEIITLDLKGSSDQRALSQIYVKKLPF